MKASSTDRSTWCSYEEAVRAYLHDDTLNGIGVMLGDGLAGVDIDHCRDPLTGEIAPWAMDIVRQIDSYAEESPSGTGLRGLCFGTLPVRAETGRRGGKRGDYPVIGSAVELYDSARYLTVTGHVLEGHTALRDATQELAALTHRLWPPSSKATRIAPTGDGAGLDHRALRVTHPSMSNKDVLRLAVASRKHGDDFRALWRGENLARHASDSEADMALVGLLAFYLGPDPERIEKLLRQSGRDREKFDRADYLDRTIQRVLGGANLFWGYRGWR